MSIPLITVQGLQISQANKTLINKVDFSIHKHDRIILVGDESYYGRFGFEKATFLKYPPPTNPDRLLYLALENNAFQDVSGLISRAE